jgi:hypothetical protein
VVTVWVVAVVVVVEDVIVDDNAGLQIVNLQVDTSIKGNEQFRLVFKESHFQIQDFPFHSIDRQYLLLLIVLCNRFHLESIDNCEHKRAM